MEKIASGGKMKKHIKLILALGSILLLATAFINASPFSIKPYFLANENNGTKTESSDLNEKARIEKIDRMFWKLSGKDSNGKPSTVYFLGTLHVGDERLFPLPKRILSAFDSADRYAGEISSKDMQELTARLMYIMIDSRKKTNGRKVSDSLSDEEKETGKAFLGSAFNQMDSFEPWVMTMTLSQEVYSSSGLEPDKGIDQVLMNKLTEQGKSWEGLDSIKTQIDVLRFGNYDQQLFMLKDALHDLRDPTEVNEYINSLYEAYLTGNTDSVSRITNESYTTDDEEMSDFMDEYNEAILINRNKSWVSKIDDWIKKGGTTFVFAGCAHFSGDHSVFRYLKDAGIIE